MLTEELAVRDGDVRAERFRPTPRLNVRPEGRRVFLTDHRTPLREGPGHYTMGHVAKRLLTPPRPRAWERLQPSRLLAAACCAVEPPHRVPSIVGAQIAPRGLVPKARLTSVEGCTLLPLHKHRSADFVGL